MLDDGIENLDGNGQPMNLVEMQDGKIRRKQNEGLSLNGAQSEFVQEQPVIGANMQFEAGTVGDVDGKKKKKKKKKAKKAAEDYGNEEPEEEAREGLLVSYK